ncbi:hypothetical protein AB0M39_00645 [Streptomyces sp. NPDC051907]|uniref:hypothetical protein n=1 Tax=Streptomyces sp. NPDC051907 TaxID=3155284 RepID=UPI0034421E19
MAGTALVTASTVLMGLVYAVPAQADEPGDHPTDPWLRTVRISLGQEARQDRCQTARAVHYGGPEMKTVANKALSGSDADVDAALKDWNWGPIGQALDRDKEAGDKYGEAFGIRHDKLNKANEPYSGANFFGGREHQAPEFGEDILAFTFGKQRQIYYKWIDNPKPLPGKAALDKAKEVFDAFDTKDDYWASQYKPFAGHELFGIGGSTPGSANDIATFLRFGGFPTKAPEPDSPEFRAEVEQLKVAWAVCDSANPIDHYRALSGVVVDAHTEWEAEYASQAKQRTEIVAAEMEASKQARAATEAMLETIRQAWLADQILYFQKFWAAKPKDDTARPKPAVFTKAAADLTAARNAAAAQVPIADKAVAAAKAAADKANASQNAAWTISDAAKTPRGRGLMYAQQSVQVAKASYAASQAAAKTALTASNAAKATAADSQALLALAKTQSHALNTEFRKAAALEAAAQAKSAAAAADAQAKEAAANATKAKNAQATAEKAEETARVAAATAKTERAKAEKEKATAAAEAAIAASERAKAQEAEARAQSERTAAGNARSAAESAGSTASSKRQEAEAAEHRAYVARDAAVAAEKRKNATDARARALEAAAAAADGSDAAKETRQAATEARAAANDATGAATRARSAANDASTAAVNARAAATRAQGAASRSRSAADNAWSAYMTTYSAAQTAHAAAAEAIDAADAAQTNAKNAEAEAKKAKAASIKAREESIAAKAEAAKTAVWAAKTAGYAFAAGQAAAGARDAAKAVTKAANEAISIGTPYMESDSSAAFAVLVGQTSKTMAEQQAAAATAKAKEAAKAAADAKALADKAAGDAKIAAQAAANAAADAAKALASAAAARTSAAEAEKAAEAAKKADAKTTAYNAQAGEDAFYADSAARDAEGSAAAANRDATDAEKDAASARSAASAAETDASSARSTATQAEKDATAAETAAKNADNASKDADAAVARAEEEARKRAEAEYAQWAKSGGQNAGPDLTADEETLLRELCGQQCVDEFRAAKKIAAGDVIDWIQENGGAILIELFGVDNIINCVSTGDLESCLWALVDVGSVFVGFLKAPAVAKAIYRIVNGIDAFYDAVKKAERTLERYRKLVEKAKKDKKTPKPPCKGKGAKASAAKSAAFKPAAGVSGVSGVSGTSQAAFSAAASSGWIDPVPCEGVTFDDPKRPKLGSDGKYYVKNGDTNVDIYPPDDLGRRITDIDLFEDGVLWEDKTAVGIYLPDIDIWMDKHIGPKFRKYVQARQHIAGYENAPIGMKFTDASINPAFRGPIEKRVNELRKEFPNVDLLLEWPT